MKWKNGQGYGPDDDELKDMTKSEVKNVLNHRHDYRWIENKKERDEWIKKYWEFKDE